MLLKVCARCKKLIPYGHTYCDECQKIVELNKSKKRKPIDPKYKRFYQSKEWKILSAKKLQDTQYKCERCGSLATEVHHIKPIQTDDGWLRRLDYNNLKSVCITCHNYYHGRYGKGGRGTPKG